MSDHHPHGPSQIGNPCNGAFHLGRLAPPQPDSAYADEGTLLHAILANPAPDEIAKLDEEQQAVVAKCLAESDRVCALVECIMPHHELRLELKDTDGSLILFGTVDMLAISPDGKHGLIVDWKFGRNPSPLASDQLACYAAMAFQAFPKLESLTVATYQPRAPQHKVGGIYEREELPCLIEQIKDKIAAREAWTLDQPLVPGDHCNNCRGALACRARRGEVTVMDATHEQTPIETLGSDDIARLLPMAKRAEKLAGLIRDRAKVLAQADQLPGWKLVDVRGRERLDASTLDIAEGLRLAGWTNEQIWEAIVFDLGLLRATAKMMPLPAGAPPNTKPEIYHLGAVHSMIGRAPGYVKLVEEAKPKEIAE